SSLFRSSSSQRPSMYSTSRITGVGHSRNTSRGKANHLGTPGMKTRAPGARTKGPRGRRRAERASPVPGRRRGGCTGPLDLKSLAPGQALDLGDALRDLDAAELLAAAGRLDDVREPLLPGPVDDQALHGRPARDR